MAGKDADSRQPLAGLFPILRQIRSRAGLTQEQIARATGAGGKHGHKLIARLEAGQISNPSLRLVLGYLRACRATSRDLSDFLDGFLGTPLVVPPRRRRGRRPVAAKGRDRDSLGVSDRIPSQLEEASNLALRREAAWWKLRRAVEVVLHQELTDLGLKPMTEERKTAALYGGKVFRSLYRTRGLRPALRERRLERCGDWAVKKRLDAVVRDSLTESLTKLFGEMNDEGQLDALPALEEARHLMLLKPSMRFVTDEAMCHHEFVTRAYERHQAHEAARKPIFEAAMNVVRSTGLSPQKIGNYPGVISAFLTVAENTEPGSTAREQRLADVLSRHQQSYFDQALLRRLADLVFTLRDQRS